MSRVIVVLSAKPVTLMALRPNQGVEAAYRRRLVCLIKLMQTAYSTGCARAIEHTSLCSQRTRVLPSSIPTKVFSVSVSDQRRV